MKDELGWGDTLPRGKVSRGQETVSTVSCPQGQDKPGGDILPWGKVSPGTRYRGDKINRYTRTRVEQNHAASVLYEVSEEDHDASWVAKSSNN